MQGIEKGEWPEIVKRLKSCEYPVPKAMIGDYDNWLCRSFAGRMLYALHDVETALMVLATTVDVQPDWGHVPENGFSEVEHKVLCLKDLAEIIWELARNGEAALRYLDEADRLCRSFAGRFRAADRGRCWVRRLEFKRECGRTAEAVAECLAMLESPEGGNSAGVVFAEEGVNPWLYYGNKFLAEQAAAAGDYAGACGLMVKAYSYFPLSAAGRDDLAAAGRLTEERERYEKYQWCTANQYRPWEYRPAARSLAELREE